MKKLFKFSNPPLMTADEMYSLFKPELSPEGSNNREIEEQTLMYWVALTNKIEGLLLNTNLNGKIDCVLSRDWWKVECQE